MQSRSHGRTKPKPTPSQAQLEAHTAVLRVIDGAHSFQGKPFFKQMLETRSLKRRTHYPNFCCACRASSSLELMPFPKPCILSVCSCRLPHVLNALISTTLIALLRSDVSGSVLNRRVPNVLEVEQPIG